MCEMQLYIESGSPVSACLLATRHTCREGGRREVGVGMVNYWLECT